MNKFIAYYQKIKPLIAKEITHFNEELQKEKNPLIKDNIMAFCKLSEAGKMLRGTLITIGYHFHHQDITHAIPLACAYEVFETSILVHDDIIDNDDIRRGMPTIHAFNKEKYHKYENEHVAKAIALCIGDYGLYKANELLMENYGKEKEFINVFKTYNDIVMDTIRGEILDVITPFEEKNHLFKDDLEKNIMDIYTLKTSWYSIVGPLLLGMILAGEKEEKRKDIIEFSLPLGIAFQIQDDLLGIFADTHNLGKTVGSDIKEYKQTLLYAYTKKTPAYKQLLEEYGQNNYDLNKVQTIFTKCGAKDYCIQKMDELYKESLYKLGNITWLDDNHKELLKDLIVYLQERKK